MIFLIDFENVNAEGFKGVELLTENDRVSMFYSSKADRFPIDLLPVLTSVKVPIEYAKAVKCVPQNVDFRIGTFVGYLIGKDENSSENIYIVSNDKGYQNVKEYWEEKGISRVRLCENILAGITADGKEVTSKPVEVATAPAEMPTPKVADTPVSNDRNYRDEIKALFDGEGVPKKNGKTNETVYKAFENCKSLGDYHFSLVDGLGRELGTRCYKLTENMFKSMLSDKKRNKKKGA